MVQGMDSISLAGMMKEAGRMQKRERLIESLTLKLVRIQGLAVTAPRHIRSDKVSTIRN
jgi:hypothetical protein